MVVESSTPQPAFQSLEPGDEYQPAKFSKLGFAAVAVSVLGLIAILAPPMMLICFLGMALGIGAAILGWRSEDGGSGLKLGTIAIALGVIGAAWATTATRLKNDYLYKHAEVNAKQFMDTIAGGDTFGALELTMPEPERQITGTNLEKYYASLDQEHREVAMSFFDTPIAQDVLILGGKADWQFVKGFGVKRKVQQAWVTVEMIDAANPNAKPIYLRLLRVTGVVVEDPKAALWNVDALLSADDAAVGL